MSLCAIAESSSKPCADGVIRKPLSFTPRVGGTYDVKVDYDAPTKRLRLAEPLRGRHVPAHPDAVAAGALSRLSPTYI
jgi:hypothetical protein